ncbi:hypothetical protein [Streptomyces malaysiense]|uniref:hypothetical protein n=1 Tax=Streptomyces malaysiense TaxID=1428626 RepID=UPI000A452FBF|nr:hypothetical protein [Streptomyces malaysiense]
MSHHHHKSNEQVEGDPDTGHGRGMPRRPDEARLAERTRKDQRDVKEERAETEREEG